MKLSSTIMLQSLQRSNFDVVNKVCRMESHIATDIVNNYFIPFKELPAEEKVSTIFHALNFFLNVFSSSFVVYPKFFPYDDVSWLSHLRDLLR